MSKIIISVENGKAEIKVLGDDDECFALGMAFVDAQIKAMGNLHKVGAISLAEIQKALDDVVAGLDDDIKFIYTEELLKKS